jgi:hypothetical protein
MSFFQYVHADTQYLYAYSVNDGDENETFLKDQLQEALNNHNPQIRLKISFTALGETINTINKKAKQEHKNEGWKRKLIHSLSDLSFHKKVDLVPPTSSIINMAKKIRNADNRLDDTDILIVSYALCDKESYLALFQDETVINSKIIEEYCKERIENRDFCHRLKIRETFS